MMLLPWYVFILAGGNSGIGKETAVALALRGARVIVACRDEDRARKAVREIKDRSHSMNVLFMEVDLANMRSIREFCKNFLQKEKRLDILVNNAGEDGGRVTEPIEDTVGTEDSACGCDYCIPIFHLHRATYPDV